MGPNNTNSSRLEEFVVPAYALRRVFRYGTGHRPTPKVKDLVPPPRFERGYSSGSCSDPSPSPFGRRGQDCHRYLMTIDVMPSRIPINITTSPLFITFNDTLSRSLSFHFGVAQTAKTNPETIRIVAHIRKLKLNIHPTSSYSFRCYFITFL